MSEILVQIVTEDGREIGWGSNFAEPFKERSKDVARAVEQGAQAIAAAVGAIPQVTGWLLDELEATFGVTLTAEAGAILTRGSAGATFEVTLTYRRDR
ncbi:CU044_2847 family protein [Nonomuraea aurantiaca]|uniref:CU044_2847 family protein n=1 Tax=Nonomuraea aurantiaca TaxID=2878562 RepID=UPI001CD9CD38|nr:CU044_2847 family protein [Nonomuraea aurantiaca]MCA2227569.1 hypothetical protein [Nonomuraea aurantiaca]